MSKSNFISGPNFVVTGVQPDDYLDIGITIPDVNFEFTSATGISVIDTTQCLSITREVSKRDHVIPVDRYSVFSKLVSVHACVIKFVYILKQRIRARLSGKLDISKDVDGVNFVSRATNDILLADQAKYFEECTRYFLSTDNKLKNIPNLVNQLNLYRDNDGLLRVKSKCGGRVMKVQIIDPVLLSKNSDLSKLIVSSLHKKMSYAGK